jgi:GH15 family glucan-1,4-alpha-glucosidase
MASRRESSTKRVSLMVGMPDQRDSYPPIEDYALVGDCGSAALVSTHGSIDWLCWPRFDSPSLFAALLDPKRGGRFQICPTEPYSVDRRYLEGTTVLETTFTTESGVLRLLDLMPVAEREAYRRTFWPNHEILRRVECVEGTVTVNVHCAPRPDYGRMRPQLTPRDELGVFCTHRGHVFVLRSEVSCTLSDDRQTLSATATLREGEHRDFSLASDSAEPAVLPLLGSGAEKRIERAVEYWRDWSNQCEYDGPYREAVTRSALTLKLMTFAASGAVVAAPTTSLPEVVGGKRNWDYRYCWLRDATFVLHAFFELGYYAEGEAFFDWLMTASRTTLPELNVLYTVYGRGPDSEETLDHFDGYRGSRPVRVGNQAQHQRQLDIYGEVIGAAYEYIQRGRKLDRKEVQLIAQLGAAIQNRWNDPDNGIWEIRGDRHHHTYSMARCAIACEQLLDLHDEGRIDIDAGAFEELEDTIREAIEEHGFNEEIGSYTRTLDGEKVDASLLLLALSDYTDPGTDRMRGTWACLEERLGAGNGLLYRYKIDDGLSGEEGAFGICSFWAVEYLTKRGDVEEAHRRFKRLLSFANDVGLFAEEIDSDTGAALGNFPQAFTHVGLINAALALAAAAAR